MPKNAMVERTLKSAWFSMWSMSPGWKKPKTSRSRPPPTWAAGGAPAETFGGVCAGVAMGDGAGPPGVGAGVAGVGATGEASACGMPVTTAAPTDMAPVRWPVAGVT